MRVDVRALGACNRLAERGAERAADALADLTGTDLAVEVTGASVASGEDLAEAFAGRESIGVSVGLDGGLDGEAVLAFDSQQADALLSLLPGGASMGRSAVTEVGNIALGGFLDGWANYLGQAIDMTPPRYFEADGAAVLPDGALAGRRRLPLREPAGRDDDGSRLLHLHAPGLGSVPRSRGRENRDCGHARRGGGCRRGVGRR